MSSGCGDVMSLEDLRTAKLHQIFEAEVITGLSGGVMGGAAIDYATNLVTGQIQKTLPAILRDAGFRPAGFTFTTGGTLLAGDSDLGVLWPVAGGGDGNYYVWKGALPKTVPAGSTPASTGGVSSSGWMPVGDVTLRTDLSSPTAGKGANIVGYTEPTSAITTVAAALNARPRSADLLASDGGAFGYKFAADASLRTSQARMAEQLSIMDYYQSADGADYGIALNRIFTKYAASLSFAVNFPQGTFNITTPAVYSGSANVFLRGQQGTVLNLNGGGTTANLAITSTRRITMEDMELVIAAPTVNGTKIGVFFNVTSQDVSHNIRNVRVTIDITNASRSVIAFDMMNPSLSSWSDVYVRYNGTLALTTGSNNIAWRVRANAKISTDSMFCNCSVVGGEIAYVITPPVGGSGGAYLEGVTWVGCTVVEVLQGVYIQGDASNAYRSPMYRWIGGHINAYQRCFYAYWVSQVTVSDAFFYLFYNATYSGSLGLYAVWVEQTVEVRIKGIGHQLTGQTAGQGQAVHIGVGSKYTVIDDVSCYTNTQSQAVVSYAGSSYTRVFNAVVFYSGLASSAAVTLNGTTDVNLGGTSVYPQ